MRPIPPIMSRLAKKPSISWTTESTPPGRTRASSAWTTATIRSWSKIAERTARRTASIGIIEISVL